MIPWETGREILFTGADVLEADDGLSPRPEIGGATCASPLLMALIAELDPGNGGVAMQPFVVGAIHLTPSGGVIAQTEPAPFARMTSSRWQLPCER